MLLLLVIKAIPVKVFGKWGVEKRTFFQKGFFPTKQFCNTPFFKENSMKKFILTLLLLCGITAAFAAPVVGKTSDIKFDYRATGSSAWQKLHVVAVIYPQMPFSVRAGAVLTALKAEYKDKNVEFFALLPVKQDKVKNFALQHPELDITLVGDVNLQFLRKLLGRKQQSFFQTSIFNHAGKLLWSGDTADLAMMLERITSGKYSEREEIRVAALTSSLQAALRSGSAKVISDAADEILQLRPEQVSAVNAKAYSLELAGNIEGLEKFYRQRMERFPENRGNYLALLQAACRIGQLNDKAPEIAGKFISKFPDDQANINAVLWSLLNNLPYSKNALQCAVRYEKYLTCDPAVNPSLAGRLLMTRALIAYRRCRGAEALKLAKASRSITTSAAEKLFVEKFIEYLTEAIK